MPPPNAEAISLLGDTLYAPALPAETRQRYEERLAEARDAWERTPERVDEAIWLGRRVAYLGRYREAVEIFTRALGEAKDDPRLYRHRGHRYITLRRLDDAVADLSRAARMVTGTIDQVEPDGLPNARNIPTSTLQSNVWYHLGLAYYLKGDHGDALRAYRECMKVSDNADMQVATAHWLYTTLRRMGRDAEAAEVLVPIRRDLDIIENRAYHRLLLMYKGELPADSVLPRAPAGAADDYLAPEDASAAYGVGAWHLYNGRTEEAVRIFRRIIAGRGQWPAFGYIAAEADLRRMGLE